jgi:hypothetical protein
MVLAFPEGGWRDLVTADDIECTDETARAWEGALRKRVFEHAHIHHDWPITNDFDLPWAVSRGGLGVNVPVTRTEPLGSFRWDPPLTELADVDKLHFSRISVDRAETARRAELADEVFGGALNVLVGGPARWSYGLTRTLIELRGPQQVLIDMYDDPAGLHRLMAFLRDNAIAELETFEREGLLSLNNSSHYVGSGGCGATDELPAPDFDGRARPCDMWALGESQEFACVGPEQFDEFALRYQAPILERFGLVCYGCCESLDRKLDLVIAALANLRRVSVGPWADREIAASKLGRRYVYSWKPNPALVSGPEVRWDEVESDIRKTLDAARGTCLEMILKDTHTFAGDPTRVERWTEIASRLAREADWRT